MVLHGKIDLNLDLTNVRSRKSYPNFSHTHATTMMWSNLCIFILYKHLNDWLCLDRWVQLITLLQENFISINMSVKLLKSVTMSFQSLQNCIFALFFLQYYLKNHLSLRNNPSTCNGPCPMQVKWLKVLPIVSYHIVINLGQEKAWALMG